MKTHRTQQGTDSSTANAPVRRLGSDSAASLLGNEEMQRRMQAKTAANSSGRNELATNQDAAKLAKTSSGISKAAGLGNKVLQGDPSLSKTFGHMGTAFDFVGCLASGDNVEESNGANVMSCLQKTAIGQIPLTGPGATPWAVASLVNSQMDVDNPAKIFTEVGANLNPYANTKAALKSLPDTVSVLTSSGSERMRKAERLENRNRQGKNSVIAQGGQAVVDVLTGDTETHVDNAAERGDRGILPAWGNCAGDYLSGAPTPLERQGGYYTNKLEKVKGDGSFGGFVKNSLHDLWDLL